MHEKWNLNFSQHNQPFQGIQLATCSAWKGLSETQQSKANNGSRLLTWFWRKSSCSVVLVFMSVNRGRENVHPLLCWFWTEDVGCTMRVSWSVWNLMVGLCLLLVQKDAGIVFRARQGFIPLWVLQVLFEIQKPKAISEVFCSLWYWPAAPWQQVRGDMVLGKVGSVHHELWTEEKWENQVTGLVLINEVWFAVRRMQNGQGEPRFSAAELVVSCFS